jgi:hypothetical protein
MAFPVLLVRTHAKCVSTGPRIPPLALVVAIVRTYNAVPFAVEADASGQWSPRVVQRTESVCGPHCWKQRGAISLHCCPLIVVTIRHVLSASLLSALFSAAPVRTLARPGEVSSALCKPLL